MAIGIMYEDAVDVIDPRFDGMAAKMPRASESSTVKVLPVLKVPVVVKPIFSFSLAQMVDGILPRVIVWAFTCQIPKNTRAMMGKSLFDLKRVFISSTVELMSSLK